jgi:NAD-dependent dihydropyrimidine dehydrogenase PreA subunit
MIEIVSANRCTKCGICVKVCPTNVFDGIVGEVPVIARQSDCQTCSMCEVYCPADALFVAPPTTPLPPGSPWLDEEWLVHAGLLGRYRELEGWGPGRTPSSRRPLALSRRANANLGRLPARREERRDVDTSLLPLDGTPAMTRATPASGPVESGPGDRRTAEAIGNKMGEVP